MDNRCPKCDFNNTSDSKYCKECGTQLPPSEEVSPFLTKTIETPVEELTRGTLFAGRYETLRNLERVEWEEFTESRTQS